MYSRPIQYLDDLHHNGEVDDKMFESTFVIEKLIQLYHEEDIAALRDFMVFVRFSVRTGIDKRVNDFAEELITFTTIMIDDIQGKLIQDRRHGLRLVK